MEYIIDTIESIKAFNQEVYSTENVELLSYGIEDKGLLEPIIVTILEKGSSPENTKYQIVSGHRRMKAIARIIERNGANVADLSYIPCIVRSKPNGSAQDDLTANEDLIDGNLFNREKSDAERAKEIQIKKRILEKRKQNGEHIPGKILMLIAAEMNISPHQAKKLDTINRNASDSVKKAFEQGALSTDAAFEFSKTDLETQDETLKQLEAEPSKTAKAVRAAIQKQRKERDKAPSVKQDKPMDAAAYLSIIKNILNKGELNHEQLCEVTKQLSAVVDYLTKTVGTV